MKKLVIVCAVALLVFQTSSVAYAKDIAGKIGIGAGWGYYLSNTFDIEGEDFKNEGSANALSLHVSYGLPKVSDAVGLNLVFDVERIERDFVHKDSGEDLGSFTLIPVTLTVQARLLTLGAVVPYVGFGAGYSFNSWDSPSFIDDDVDLDDSFCMKIPIGADIFVTDNIALNVEARYVFNDPDISGGGKEVNGDQSTFAFGVGVTYYFD